MEQEMPVTMVQQKLEPDIGLYHINQHHEKIERQKIKKKKPFELEQKKNPKNAMYFKNILQNLNKLRNYFLLYIFTLCLGKA